MNNKVEDEISIDEFEKLEANFERKRLVNWLNVEEEYDEKIVEMSTFIKKIRDEYKCSVGCVRRKVYSWRDKEQVEIRYMKKNNKMIAIIKFNFS